MYDSPNDFVRPMLNTPIGHSAPEADLLIAKVKARLDASHVANKILTGWVYTQTATSCTGLSFEDWIRLMLIWQSLQNRSHSGR
jgi:hypothetical protein